MSLSTIALSVQAHEKMSQVSLTTFLNALRAVCDADPDRVAEKIDNQCVYQNDGEPSCVIGRALVNLGVDPLLLSQCEGRGAKDVLATLGVTDERIIRMGDFAQGMQDAEMPWRYVRLAVDHASFAWIVW